MKNNSFTSHKIVLQQTFYLSKQNYNKLTRAHSCTAASDGILPTCLDRTRYSDPSTNRRIKTFIFGNMRDLNFNKFATNIDTIDNSLIIVVHRLQINFLIVL